MAGQVIRIGDVEVERQELPIDELIRITEESPVRVVDKEAEAKMIAAIDAAKEDGDTLGGIVEVIIEGVPVGLGSHVQWDRKLDGRIAQAVFPFKLLKVWNSASALKLQSAEALMFMMKSCIRRNMALVVQRIVLAALKAE